MLPPPLLLFAEARAAFAEIFLLAPVVVSLFAGSSGVPVIVKQHFATYCKEPGVGRQHRLIAGHETQVPEYRAHHNRPPAQVVLRLVH